MKIKSFFILVFIVSYALKLEARTIQGTIHLMQRNIYCECLKANSITKSSENKRPGASSYCEIKNIDQNYKTLVQVIIVLNIPEKERLKIYPMSYGSIQEEPTQYLEFLPLNLFMHKEGFIEQDSIIKLNVHIDLNYSQDDPDDVWELKLSNNFINKLKKDYTSFISNKNNGGCVIQ